MICYDTENTNGIRYRYTRRFDCYAYFRQPSIDAITLAGSSIFDCHVISYATATILRLMLLLRLIFFDACRCLMHEARKQAGVSNTGSTTTMAEAEHQATRIQKAGNCGNMASRPRYE